MFLKFFLVLSTALVLTSGQEAYPIATDLAKQCLKVLNQTNVVTDCYNKAMAKWPAQKNGQEDDKWLERDTCCVQFDQIDCKISAINSGKCTGDSAKAALDYQNKMVNYWNTTHCLSVPYKSGMCKVKAIPPTFSLQCLTKALSESMACMVKIAKDWNVTIDQLSGKGQGVANRTYCCGNWQVGDCVLNVVKKDCNSIEIKIEQDGLDTMIQTLGAGKCTSYKYGSDACPHASASISTINKLMTLFLFFAIVGYFKN